MQPRPVSAPGFFVRPTITALQRKHLMTLSSDQITPLIAALAPLADRKKALQVAMKAYVQSKGEEYEAAVAAMKDISELTDPIETVIKDELEALLPTIGDKGLAAPAETEGSVIFADVWGEFCKSGWAALPDYRKDDLCQSLAKTYTAAVANAREQLGDAGAAEALVAWIAAGDCPLTCGGDDYFKNFADGSQAFLLMENWAPHLVARSADGEVRPLACQPDDLAFHQTISFPSGRLLVADSVRTRPVIEALDALRDEAGFNINYGTHRVARTSLSACLCNIVDIAMGDDGPSMVQGASRDILFAGRDDDTFAQVASVCHDYWGTVIVDREIAISLATEAGQSQEQAEAEIDNWLESSRHATEVTVPAGTYHLYWDDDRETLDKMLRNAGIPAPEDTRFALSREPLTALEGDKRMKSLARYGRNADGEIIPVE